MTYPVSIPRSRYVRHSRKDVAGSRLNYLKAWLDARIAAFAGTATTQSINSVDTGADTVDVTGHGYATGAGPFLVTSDGTVPAGLDDATPYYVRAVSTDDLAFYISRQDALEDANRIVLTGAGTGSIVIAQAVTDQTLMEHMRDGVKPETLEESTDIDDFA